MQIIGCGNYGEEQGKKAAKKEERTGAIEASQAMTRRSVATPDQERRQREHQPQKVEQQFHDGQALTITLPNCS